MDLTGLYDLARTVVDNLVTVTLTRPSSFVGGATTSVTVNNVQVQAPDESEIDTPMGGSLEGTKGRFRMWLVEALAMPPHVGYLITRADGSVWEINRVDVLCHGREFRCHATRRPS